MNARMTAQNSIKAIETGMMLYNCQLGKKERKGINDSRSHVQNGRQTYYIGVEQFVNAMILTTDP